MDDPRIWYEIIGYAGMAFVIVSFLFRDIRLLRIFNLVGAVLSGTYGVLTKTWPTAILNIILAVINIAFPIRYMIHLHVQKKKEKLIEDDGLPQEKEGEEEIEE